MEFLTPLAVVALPATAFLLLTLLGWRVRQRSTARGSARRDSLDTVADWPPDPARVLTVDERQAFELIKRALPDFLILAQVPLSRFLRVPLRRSYGDWLQRVGSLSADLLVCDSGSRVLAVIDIRAVNETERGKRRHERMTRVLEAAGIEVHIWREGSLPSISTVRNVMSGLAGPAAEGMKPVSTGSMPLLPVPEMHEVLAEGDRAAALAAIDPNLEPVSSGFFDDLEAIPGQR
jgi:hypothetical protein